MDWKSMNKAIMMAILSFVFIYSDPVYAQDPHSFNMMDDGERGGIPPTQFRFERVDEWSGNIVIFNGHDITNKLSPMTQLRTVKTDFGDVEIEYTHTPNQGCYVTSCADEFHVISIPEGYVTEVEKITIDELEIYNLKIMQFLGG